MQRSGDLLRHISLNLKNVCELSIVLADPQVLVGRRVDELRIYTHAVSNSLHSSFNDRRHAELFADLAQILRRVLVQHRGGVRDDVNVIDCG